MNKKTTCLIFSLVTLFVLILSPFSEAFVVNRTPTGATIKWFTNNTTYYINTSGGPAGSLSAIQNAMQTWTNAPANFSFIYGGTTTSTAYGTLDYYNMIGFGSLPVGTVGENSRWYYVNTGQLLDCDIRLNTYYSWATDGSANSFDVESVALHELGHSLSLGNVDSPADAAMYRYISKGQIKRSLHQDDIDGIVFIYGPGTSPVYRFWSDNFKHHFYTMNEAEKNHLICCDSNWRYEGIACYAWPTQASGTSPVYRFWSDVFKGHFYTMNEAEKNYLICCDSNWRYEGIAYYAWPTQASGTSPVYRFWSDVFKGHFYTMNEAEKNYLICCDPNWRYEGIAWYAVK